MRSRRRKESRSQGVKSVRARKSAGSDGDGEFGSRPLPVPAAARVSQSR